jgi:hypothetical protein
VYSARCLELFKKLSGEPLSCLSEALKLSHRNPKTILLSLSEALKLSHRSFKTIFLFSEVLFLS